MAEDPTEQAIAISTGIVSALSAAGVLHGQGTTPTRAPTPPEPKVGDVASAQISGVAKFVQTDPSFVTYSLTPWNSLHGYTITFPPNDEVYRAELDRLFTIDRPVLITVSLKITGVSGPNYYAGELEWLWVSTAIGEVRL